MFNILFRRLQKHSRLFNILSTVTTGGLLVGLVINTPPELGNVAVVAVLLILFVTSFLSLFFRPQPAFIAGLGISLFLFLKAVDLLTPINTGLLVLFLILTSYWLHTTD